MTLEKKSQIEKTTKRLDLIFEQQEVTTYSQQESLNLILYKKHSILSA
jgi:hypothetical protein